MRYRICIENLIFLPKVAFHVPFMFVLESKPVAGVEKCEIDNEINVPNLG